MTRDITLPTVSIGGYGALLDDLPIDQLFQRSSFHDARVEQLTHELAAELARKDLAAAAVTKRLAM